MQDIAHIFHILICVGLIGFILIQHGKGADMGAGFGSGASGTVFGSQGAGNFLTRTTTALAIAFFLSSLLLAYLTTQLSKPSSVVDNVEVPVMPATTAPAPAAATESTVPVEAITPESTLPAVPEDTTQ